MKLVYVLTTADARAGTEKTFADQARAMHEHGHEVRVASLYKLAEKGFDFGDGVEIDYITALPAPTEVPSTVVPAVWDNQFCADADAPLVDYFRACDADIVVTSTPGLTIFALLGLPPHVRIVQEEHRPSMARGKTAEPLLIHGPRVDALVNLTDRDAQWLREKWGDNAPRIEVIPNALPATGRPQSSGRQRVIMGAGRLVHSKGFADLVRAFALVAPEFPDWRLRIFGDGPQRDSLITAARDLGIAGRVEIAPPTPHIEAEWSRVSIGALASRYEGLPLVLLEARGAGLPVVAYDCVTGPREIIEDGEDGYLVGVGDVEGFADRLRCLMGDDDLRERMGATAVDSLARFSPEVVAAQWSALFAELVEGDTSVRQLRDATGQSTAEDVPTAEKDVIAPAPVSDGGNVRWVEPEDLTVRAARELNRQEVSEALSGLGLTCRPLRTDSSPSWALPSTQRVSALNGLRALDDDALEVRVYAGRTRLDTDGVAWRKGIERIEDERVTHVYAFLHLEHLESGVHMGYDGGLVVEFWEPDAQRVDLWRARRRNSESQLLRADQFDRPVLEPWAPQLGAPLWSDVSFPIDAVYTWVDGADPEWRARKSRLQTDAAGFSTLAAGDLRYLSRDELRYSLRSLNLHAPWIRNIFVVTDDQRPSWLADHPRVTVVSHRDLFPDPSVLPVFNSHAIETVVHRIPGLAEHFLYLNDDGFFLREQRPEQYFTPTGAARLFASPTKINDLGEAAEPHERAGENNRALIREEFGVTITQAMLHAPYPHLRSVLSSVEERFPEAMARTRVARFRSGTDVSMLSSLGQYVGFLDGRYAQGSLRVGFVALGTEDTPGRLASARGGKLDFFTFGESDFDPDPQLTLEYATNFMAAEFPIPGPWERG